MNHLKNKETKCPGCGEFKIVFSGSVMNEYNEPGFHGISHLIEHCMCEKVKEIEPEMKMLGLEWNAYTTDTEMAFFIYGLTKSIDRMREKFLNAIINYKISREVFEREREVVISEYIRNFSDQLCGFYYNFNRLHYGFCDTIGLKSDLENITYEKFMEFKNRYFSAPAFLGYVCHAGHRKIDEQWLAEYAAKYGGFDFSEIPVSHTLPLEFHEKSISDYPVEVYSNFDSQRIILMNMEMPMGDDFIGFSNIGIMDSILNDGLTSILYREIREKTGHVYAISPWLSDIGNHRFNYSICISVQNEYADEIMELMKKTMNSIKSFIDEKSFSIAMTKIKNKYELRRRSRYTDSFDENDEKIKQNILDNKIDYSGFMKFTDDFMNAPKYYFRDDELLQKESK